MTAKFKTELNGFDFHCHVDLHPNPPSLIQQYERRRIGVLAVTTTPKAWPQNREWTKYSKFVHAAVGLHPELVGQRFAELALLENYIAETRLIGEIGLDGNPQHRDSYTKQQEVFNRSLVAAQSHGGRVVTIHSRRAATEVVEAIAEHTDHTRVLCILHWFSGSLSELRYASELGCYFSVNSAMLRSEHGIKIIRNIPKNRILTETDFPFDSVDGHEGKRLDTFDSCDGIAKARGASLSEIKQQLRENSTLVFQFAGICIE